MLMASAGAFLIGSNLPDEDSQNNEVSQSNENSQNLRVGHQRREGQGKEGNYQGKSQIMRRQFGLKTGVIWKLSSCKLVYKV